MKTKMVTLKTLFTLTPLWAGALCACGVNIRVFDAAVTSTNTTISSSTESAYCDGYVALTDHDALGSGTTSDPYLICTAAQFVDIGATSSSWTKHFKLMGNIGLSDYDETTYTPIGNSTTKFVGTLDGNSKTISNFTYTDATKDYVGIFGSLSGPSAEIRNLTITNVTIQGRDRVGGLVGQALWGKITNVFVSGTVSGRDFVGGVIGLGHYGKYSSLASDVTVGQASGQYIGGIIGSAVYAYLTNSYSRGNVSSTGNSVGGVMGYATATFIGNSYSTGNVTSTGTKVGGILGESVNESKLDHVFAVGNVTGNSAAADIGRIAGSFITGSVSASSRYAATGSCTNNGIGGCSAYGSSADNSGGGDPTYFYNSSNVPLSSWEVDWDSAGVWTKPSSDYPVLNPQIIDEETWGTCASHASDTPFAGGIGSLENPYRICTASQLYNLGNSASYWSYHHFKMMDDVDISAYTGSTWPMIGSFKGTFDGNGKVIEGFTVDSTTTSKGFIRSPTYAHIFRLGMTSVAITTQGFVGAGSLAGTLSKGTLITDCYAQGTIGSSQGSLGGLVGSMNAFSRVYRSYANVDVEGNQNNIGGFTSYLISTATVDSSFSVGNVVNNGAASNHGPFIGWSNGGMGASTYRASTSTCTNCGNATGTSVDTSGGGTKCSYFSNKSTDVPLTTWDFDNTWIENGGDCPIQSIR